MEKQNTDTPMRKCFYEEEGDENPTHSLSAFIYIYIYIYINFVIFKNRNIVSTHNKNTPYSHGD